MKFWLKISISLLLIVFSFIILSSINYYTSLPYAGSFVLTIGSSFILTIGILLLLFLLTQMTRKKESFKNKDILKRIEEKLYDRKLEDIEGALAFEIGNMASFLKKRGTETEKITEKGYTSYEEWIIGIREAARWVLEKYPRLQESRLITLLAYIDENIDPTYWDKIIEHFSSVYEEYKRLGFNYIPSQGLKSLTLNIEKYVRRDAKRNK
ncbi:MAG: hypothetical protein QW412_02755 [Candidatus Aenigmatarchaeota archaeon]